MYIAVELFQYGLSLTARMKKGWFRKQNIGIEVCVCVYIYIYIFIHSSLTTGLKPPPKRFLHTVRSRASSFKWQYPLLSLRSSSSSLRLLPRILVTSISPFIFPSITCFRRQFLRKMWPIQLAFRFLISCRIFLCSLTLSNTSSFLTWSVQLIFYILLQYYISKLSRYFWSAARSVHVIEKFQLHHRESNPRPAGL